MQPGPFPPDVLARVALRSDGDEYAGIESAYLATRWS
jgi:hypothetical protein